MSLDIGGIDLLFYIFPVKRQKRRSEMSNLAIFRPMANQNHIILRFSINRVHLDAIHSTVKSLPFGITEHSVLLPDCFLYRPFASNIDVLPFLESGINATQAITTFQGWQPRNLFVCEFVGTLGLASNRLKGARVARFFEVGQKVGKSGDFHLIFGWIFNYYLYQVALGGPNAIYFAGVFNGLLVFLTLFSS